MGKNKKGFNWKARQQNDRAIDNSQTQKLNSRINLSEVNQGKGYDDSNALVLPSEKRKSKKLKGNEPVGKILSKRRRKYLEKIVEKKNKKAERSDLLSKLEAVKAHDDELSKLKSIADIQTKGLKRHFAEEDWKQLMEKTGQTIEQVQNAEEELTQPKRVKLKVKKEIVEKSTEHDPNVLGFSASSSESSDESDDLNDGIEPESQKVGQDLKINNGEKEVEKSSQLAHLDTDNMQSGDIECKQPSSESTELTYKNETKLKSIKMPASDTDKQKISKCNRKFIPVNRTPEVQEIRNKLPIIKEEQPIMESINENPITVLIGETGSGKTTQVPQFLYEAGYAHEKRKDGTNKLIGVTEPRRVAAMSMANRVSYEMNMKGVVSYQIRFEGNTGPETRIKYMTDGILLRELEQDVMLSKYSVIVIDEAHERSYRSDILIGFLSRIVRQRDKDGDPLKLVIMSATLNIEDFTKNEKLFRVPPPVVKVESRQFDVTCHFNKRTPEDNSEAYTEEALRKVCKIHRTLPEGGILVFVTGQQEVKEIVKRLNRLFPPKKGFIYDNLNSTAKSSNNMNSNNNLNKRSTSKKHNVPSDQKLCSGTENHSNSHESSLPNINLDKVRILPLDDDTEADLSTMKADDDISVSDEENESLSTFSTSKTEPPLWTLPLYSLLSSEKQARVFQSVPEGHRLCVVATNVAETSLTIPGVKYVVDTGKEKIRHYDKLTGVTNYVVGWISKASANQRAGRAGRQSTGHCYRLYSSAVFEHEFANHSKPEIRSIPLEELVLLMKAMHIENVINFPFPTPPDPKEIRQAEQNLLALGALQQPAKNLSLKEMEKYMKKAQITPLGRAMSLFPLAPRFAKMLVLSGQHGRNFMQYTITMLAALSMQEVLIEIALTKEEIQPQNQPRLNQIRKSWAGTGNSLLLGDPMILIRAVGACEYAGYTQEFCEQNGLRYKAMVEIRKLRNQLTNKVNDIWPNLNVIMNPKMQPPSDQDSKLLRQIILSGSPDQIARKIQEDDLKEASDKSKMKLAYKCGQLEEPVFLKR